MQTEATTFRRALMHYVNEYGDRKGATVGMINRVDHTHLFAMHNCELIDTLTPRGVVKTAIRGLSVVDGE